MSCESLRPLRSLTSSWAEPTPVFSPSRPRPSCSSPPSLLLLRRICLFYISTFRSRNLKHKKRAPQRVLSESPGDVLLSQGEPQLPSALKARPAMSCESLRPLRSFSSSWAKPTPVLSPLHPRPSCSSPPSLLLLKGNGYFTLRPHGLHTKTFHNTKKEHHIGYSMNCLATSYSHRGRSPNYHRR